MASSPIISWHIDGREKETMADFVFLGSKITVVGDCSHEIKRRLLLGSKAMTNLDSILKRQRCHFADKSPASQTYDFSSSHVWMWKLHCKEGWVLKNMLSSCDAGEDSWESLGQQGDQTSQS